MKIESANHLLNMPIFFFNFRHGIRVIVCILREMRFSSLCSISWFLDFLTILCIRKSRYVHLKQLHDAIFAHNHPYLAHVVIGDICIMLIGLF